MMSGINLETIIEALQIAKKSKKNFNIIKLCASCNEHTLVSNKVSKLYIKNGEYDSCVQCIKSMINVALLLINDQYTLNEEVSITLHRLGCIQKEAKKYSESIKCHSLCLAVKHVINKKHASETSMCYRCIGEVCAKQQDH